MAEEIIRRDVTHDISSSYLEYAIDVIIARALPDVRDGLKPVHRRILYAMYETNNIFTKPHKKSARTVGEVLGKYHPHGDSSVYDAMVRMAQDFSLRYPMIDGHGNFGSVDGDPAAAMRYTEARMSKISDLMLEDINKNTIDMMKNYDGSLDEPKVLPANLPYLLINGVEGIAVGMATKMPPHNLSEVLEGVIAKLDDPSLDSEGLMKYIKGPDFPLGGIIVGTSGIREMYTTGRGTITVRSPYRVEEKKGGKLQLIFTTVPYQVNKSELVAYIDNMVQNKTLDGVTEVRDETSMQDGIRIVLDLARNANPSRIVKSLYKNTKLQDNFGANMNALVPRSNGNLSPKQLTLEEIVSYWIAHRKEVVQRKYEFLLQKKEARLHIVEGLIKATNIIDKVIEAIRKSNSTSEAKGALTEKFGFSSAQADAILEYRLQQLVGLEINKLTDEENSLKEEIRKYKEILSSDENIRMEVKRNCQEVLNKYGDERKTQIMYDVKSDGDGEDDEEERKAEIEDKQVVVTITNTGYIKSVPLDDFTAQSRGGKGSKGLKNSDIDIITQMITVNKRNILLCLGSDGRMYKLYVSDIAETSKTARGQYLNTLIEADVDVNIVAIIEVESMKNINPDDCVLMFTKMGGIKKIQVSELVTSRRSVMAIKLKNSEDEVINACHVPASGKAFVATKNGMLLVFDYTKVTPHGRASGTVRAIKLKPGDYAVSADIITNEDASLLTVTNVGMGKKTKISDYPCKNVGTAQGITNYKTNEKVYVVSVINIDDEKDILVSCSNGKIIRIPSNSLRDIGRTSKGVRLLNMEEKEEVSSVSSAIKTEKADDESTSDGESEGESK